MGVLIPIVTDPWGIFVKFRNSNVLWYCHPKFISYGLATGAFGLGLLILSYYARRFSKKIMQFFQGEMSNTSGEFSLCTITSTTWFLQSDDWLGYGLLFQRPVWSTKALQHVCKGTAATTLSVVKVGQQYQNIFKNLVHLQYGKAKPVTHKKRCFFTRLEMV